MLLLRLFQISCLILMLLLLLMLFYRGQHDLLFQCLHVVYFFQILPLPFFFLPLTKYVGLNLMNTPPGVSFKRKSIKMEPTAGFEPATPTLPWWCSTD